MFSCLFCSKKCFKISYKDLTNTITKLLQELDNEDVGSKRRSNLRLMVEICKVQGQVLRDTELMKAMDEYKELVETVDRRGEDYYL